MSLDVLPELSPNSFATVDEAMAYMKRDRAKEPVAELWARMCLNAVVERFELETGRRLCGRVHRTAAALTATMADDSASVTGITTTTVKEFDDVVHASLPAGTRVASVDSGTTLTLTKQSTAAIVAGSLTFGSAPLVTNGLASFTYEGYWRLWCPEFPLHAVYSVSARGADGTLTALTTTGARIERDTGLIVLPQAAPQYGERNIEIECLAGYLPPAAGSRRGFDGWGALKQLTLRAVEVLWQDWSGSHGRGGDVSIVNATQRIYDFKWPADIARGLDGLGRRW